ILLSGESERVMHSVQKLIGGQQLTILGALTKPAHRDALRSLLECWQPRPSASASKPVPRFAAEDLRTATSEQQWILHYQPQVDLKSGALVGLEALVRWNHPELGVIYPDQFISAVEDNGQITELTEWVLMRALQDLAIWRGSEVHPHIAVNISMQSLLQPGYWRCIAVLVGEAGATPLDVVLEVTETRLADSFSVPLENLVRLRLAGFTLSIDDFGTGHSSLAQLRDVPFTELKVDRGFVHGARNNQIIRPMLEGSLGIARRLGMRSVAEGIETQDDWELLCELDCDLAQGYFIGKPMSAHQLLGWLVTWQARQSLVVC
ncbi:MAG TPA: EAL domain-containing response regulator, partial [Steroidobacteraceae bacterium]|nr:EAL domain-containing response regulator [Steroidobacteraceae bacterium]